MIPDNITSHTYTSDHKPTKAERGQIIDFLYHGLEHYGDPKEQIGMAIDYALKEVPSFGGFVKVYSRSGQIVAAVVINKTGMSAYIPENILVYIAVDPSTRGQGIGKALLAEALAEADGGVALHVDEENPARRLYERMGFECKYLEMRYTKPSTNK